jgi:polysaccharide biosynthesis protein VpsQ
MKSLAVLVAAVIVFAIVVSNLGYGPGAFAFVERIPGTDLTAHFALYALFSFAVNAALAGRAGGRSRYKITAVLAAIVVLEEWSQRYFPARTFSIADLSASLLGIAAGAAASALLARVQRGGAHRDAVR